MAHNKGKFNPNRYKKVVRKQLAPDEWIDSIRQGHLNALSQAITLLESDQPKDQQIAQQLLLQIPAQQNAWMIGVSGPPGAGKSTLIEQLGLIICASGLKVAVLAIDPSSDISGGSILGDKTRMEKLSKHPNAFIRPSPNKGVLGGISAYTREVSLLCAMGGYDVVLIESVGVGQSEYRIRDIVDFMMLVLAPGTGDDLQGIKKGILEVVDCFVINKADGDHLPLARKTYQSMRSTHQQLEKPILLVSALLNEGVQELWHKSQSILQKWSAEGTLSNQRIQRELKWFRRIFEYRVSQMLWNVPGIQSQIQAYQEEIKNQKTSPMQAAYNIINFVQKKLVQ